MSEIQIASIVLVLLLGAFAIVKAGLKKIKKNRRKIRRSRVRLSPLCCVILARMWQSIPKIGKLSVEFFDPSFAQKEVYVEDSTKLIRVYDPSGSICIRKVLFYFKKGQLRDDMSHVIIESSNDLIFLAYKVSSKYPAIPKSDMVLGYTLLPKGLWDKGSEMLRDMDPGDRVVVIQDIDGVYELIYESQIIGMSNLLGAY